MKKLLLFAGLFLLPFAAQAQAPAQVNGCQYNGTPPALNDKQTVVFQCDENGGLIISGTSGGVSDVNIAKIGGATVDTGIGTGGSATLRTAIDTSQTITLGVAGTAASNVMTVQGIASMTPVIVQGVAGGVAQPVSLSAATTGGCTPGVDIADASTNATAVTGAAATLCSLNVMNTTTTIYYLLVFNKATAPTCNSDTPVHVVPIMPASAAGQLGGVVAGTGPFGEAFSAGFAYCITAAVAGTGNAAVGVFVNYSTK